MKNISNFNNTSDYLPIFNGVLITEIIILSLVYIGFFKSKVLLEWYDRFHIFALLADVLIIVIGFIITRFLYYKIFNKYSLSRFLILFLVIQITHDVLFYLFFNYGVPKGKNKMIDLFKKYGEEKGWKAILGDSTMIVLSVLFATYYKNLSLNNNIILLITFIYLICYIIFF
tara:strand:- start:80 stop:595 length:516 start_codon:yes stop_codon:yes gene_type:complete